MQEYGTQGQIGHWRSTCPLELKRKMCSALDFKEEKGNSHGDKEAHVWWTNVCWAIFNYRPQRGLSSKRPS